MIEITGRLVDALGNPIPDCKIELKARKNSSSVFVRTSAYSSPDGAGYYRMDLNPGAYAVTLWIDGCPPNHVGDITVYADSPSGTLNNFLLNPNENEVTPEWLTQAMQARADAQQAEKSAANYASNANSAAEKAKQLAQETINQTTDMLRSTVKSQGERHQNIEGVINAQEVQDNGNRVYSPLNKPSAADIGAIDNSGGEVNGNLNVTGILKEHGIRVYSPNNKPNADDVGALPKGGGDVTSLTINGDKVATVSTSTPRCSLGITGDSPRWAKIATGILTPTGAAGVSFIISGANNFGSIENQTDLVSFSARKPSKVTHTILNDTGYIDGRCQYGYIINESIIELWLYAPHYANVTSINVISGYNSTYISLSNPLLWQTIKPSGIQYVVPSIMLREGNGGIRAIKSKLIETNILETLRTMKSGDRCMLRDTASAILPSDGYFYVTKICSNNIAIDSGYFLLTRHSVTIKEQYFGIMMSDSNPVWYQIITKGDYGIGGSRINITTQGNDLDYAGIPTAFYHFNKNTSLGSAPFTYAYVMHIRETDTNSAQMAFDVTSNSVKIRTSTSTGFKKWDEFITTANSTVDSNGFYKKASPILRLFAHENIMDVDGFTKSGYGLVNSAASGVVAKRIDVGHYEIHGSLGFAKEGWYITLPEDTNGNKKIFAEYFTDENNIITIKTYTKKFDFDKCEVIAGEPVDITPSRWIDLRLDMTENDQITHP